MRHLGRQTSTSPLRRCACQYSRGPKDAAQSLLLLPMLQTALFYNTFLQVKHNVCRPSRVVFLVFVSDILFVQILSSEPSSGDGL